MREGLIAVLGAVEPCLAVTVRGCSERRWLAPALEQRKCLHLYHYYEHPLVGRCHVRLLRAHGLIRKLPHTHRYLITESGRAILTALVATQEADTQKLTLALAA